MMLINLSDVLSRDGKMVQRQQEIEMDIFKSRLGSFSVIRKTPLNLLVTNTGNRELLVEGNIDLWINIPCARCVDDVNTEFHLEISRVVDMKQSEAERIKELNEDSYIEGYNLDIDKLVYIEILVNWPMKVLCSESCKGICNRCGTNLNCETCDCDSAGMDPRMAAISDIFNNFKEV